MDPSRPQAQVSSPGPQAAGGGPRDGTPAGTSPQERAPARPSQKTSAAAAADNRRHATATKRNSPASARRLAITRSEEAPCPTTAT
jgi:hypothetical protein